MIYVGFFVFMSVYGYVQEIFVATARVVLSRNGFMPLSAEITPLSAETNVGLFGLV